MKIKKINQIKLKEPVPVYDIELAKNNNFKLSAGVIVHNSKDIADAWGGVIYNAHIKMKHYEEPMLIVPIQNALQDITVENYDDAVEKFEKWVKEGDLYSNETKRYSKNVREIGGNDVGGNGGSETVSQPPTDDNRPK